MSTDTPRPERVTLRDEVAAVIRGYFKEPNGYTLIEVTIRDTDAFADALADILIASPALARVIREAKAEAWDEGYRAGCDDGHDHARGLTAGRPNPYREDVDHTTQGETR